MPREPLQANDVQSHGKDRDQIGTLDRFRLLRQSDQSSVYTALPLGERPTATAGGKTSQVPDREVYEAL